VTPRAALGGHRLRRIVDSLVAEVVVVVREALATVAVDDVLGFVALLQARPAAKSRF